MPSAVAIAFAADTNMEYPLHVAIVSVLRHISPAVLPHFYLSLDGIDAKGLALLKGTLDAVGKPYLMDVLPAIDKSNYAGFETLHGALAHYNRLFFADLIPDDRILYIDADTVTCVDVAPLFSLDMSGHTLGAVLDGTVAQAGDGYVYRKLGMPEDTPVFNSGVILINAQRWRAEGRTAETLELCKMRFKSGDQPALNYVFRNQVLDIGLKYNIKLYPHHKAALPAEGIFHFLGSPKPWDVLGGVFNAHSSLYARELVATKAFPFRYNRYFRIETYRRALRIAGGYYRVLKTRFA